MNSLHRKPLTMDEVSALRCGGDRAGRVVLATTVCSRTLSEVSAASGMQRHVADGSGILLIPTRAKYSSAFDKSSPARGESSICQRRIDSLFGQSFGEMTFFWRLQQRQKNR
jgi:hypothetical protein